MSGDPSESGALGVGYRLATPPSALLTTTALQHEVDAVDVLWEYLSLADLAHACMDMQACKHGSMEALLIYKES